MAGIKASFVEPKLTLKYFLEKIQETKDDEEKQELEEFVGKSIPLPGHVASGVGVRYKDERGKEYFWILDMTLEMLQADYVQKEYPYLELSLRQYWMADLSNLGVDQRKLGMSLDAQDSYELALRMGLDSTAHHALMNYAVLWEESELDSRATTPLQCHSRESCSRSAGKMAYQLSPQKPQILYHYALDIQEKRPVEAVELYLEAIKLDPRYFDIYKEIIWLINNFEKRGRLKRAQDSWTRFVNSLTDTLTIKDRNKKPLFEDTLRDIFNQLEKDVELKEKIDNPLLWEKVMALRKQLGIDKDKEEE